MCLIQAQLSCCESTAVCAGLFSATQTEAVEQLARAGLRNAVRVCVDVAASNTHSQQHQQQQNKQQAPVPQPNSMQRTPSSLQIEYQTCDHTQKVQQLVSFIQVSFQAYPLQQRCPSTGRTIGKNVDLTVLCMFHVCSFLLFDHLCPAHEVVLATVAS